MIIVIVDWFKCRQRAVNTCDEEEYEEKVVNAQEWIHKCPASSM